MALGIVSSNEFEAALKDSSMSNDEVNATKGQIIDIPSRGRKEGDVNVPSSLRKVIGAEGNIEGRPSALSIARSFGISNSQVAAYSNGATSDATYHDKDKGLSDHITNAKMKVTKRAMSKLLKSMHHITDDKLSEASVTELSAVAKNMSAIVKDMNPSEDNKGDRISPVQFIVMAPQILNENRFETIYAKE